MRLGDFEVYYSAFNSTFISPEIAAAFQLERNPHSGIINIAIRNVKNSLVGKAVTGRIEGNASNLLSQQSGLQFKEVREGDAIYYLASFKFHNEEQLRFDLAVWPQNQAQSARIQFSQQFFELE